MTRGPIQTRTITSVDTDELCTDGHALSAVTLVITGAVTASVEKSNSSGHSTPLWEAYDSMSGLTGSQTGTSFYSYEKVRLRVTALTGSATTPDGTGNTGNGTMSAVTCTASTISEDWTLTCTDDSGSGNETWSVVGSVSGAQTNATTGVAYNGAGGKVAFTINDGAVDYVAGDAWTFTTTQGTAKLDFTGFSGYA